jgi:tRNA(Ile)-lysidine synthase
MLDRVTVERFAAIAGEDPLIVAFSGGGDSTALLHLLAERLGPSRLLAVIVDHALRKGSADDAEAARATAQRLGVEARVATLSWPDGARRGQQSARLERYRALCGVARDCGARVIALAHTLDDQVETVFMRAAAGSTWRGLAGMAPLAPAPLWPDGRGVLLARPLLQARRAAIRDLLTARALRWIEDPANANPAYERVRVRSRLAELEAAGLDVTRVARLTDVLRPASERLDRDAAALVARAARFEGERIVLETAAWTGDVEARRRALSVLIAAASGRSREPGGREIERLEARLGTSGFRGAALGGSVVRQGREISIERDRGALEGRSGGAPPLQPLPLPMSRSEVWDGRLELCAREPGFQVRWSGDSPVLERSGQTLALAEAADLVAARWLLEDHVRHLLAQEINAAKRS